LCKRLSSPTILPDDESVSGDIHGERRATQYPLVSGRQSARVQSPQEVVFYEPARVTRLTGPRAKRILQWSERTDPPGELDENAPYRSRGVEPHQPSPSERQKSTYDDEDHERSVNDDDTVGEPAENHESGGTNRADMSRMSRCRRRPNRFNAFSAAPPAVESIRAIITQETFPC